MLVPIPKTTWDIYLASNPDATRALYARLEALGPVGIVALNLFRAQKASARAKVYRRSYKGMAYDKKQWSMDNLCRELSAHASDLNIRFGWKQDPLQSFHNWVLYVDLPDNVGQVSFHTSARGLGPDYPADWDRIPEASPPRICRWCSSLLSEPSNAPLIPPQPSINTSQTNSTSALQPDFLSNLTLHAPSPGNS